MNAVQAPHGDQTIVDIRAREHFDSSGVSLPDNPRKVGRRLPLKATVPAAAVAIIGFLAAWFLLYALGLTGLQEHGSQSRLYDSYRLQLAAATAPLGGVIKHGSPVALLSAPSAGIRNVVIVEGTTAGLLTTGPGHLIDTPLPGQAGMSVILGRSVTFGGPFGEISQMRVGDRITVTTAQGTFTFKIYGTWGPGKARPRPVTSDQAGLTLVTSTSSGWRSGWAPSHTIYVDASLAKGTPQPAPGGRLSSVSRVSLPMQANTKALIPLVLWCLALVVAGLGVAWSWFRWGRKQSWMVGLPILLGLLWGTSGALMEFLPNLL